ncbi:uncharacterized protein [Clytia hemisphaerica]|uniref:uncharacterized protein n=1 Tax=Clytia hemisphaerica TaxID=252671 RepID=UPI0034D640CC
MSQIINSGSISCKSCGVCQKLLKHFQQHISTIHILTGAEGVIGNAILNLLTLLIPEGPNHELKQLNRTVPVISKPPEKHIQNIEPEPTTEVINKNVIQSYSGDFAASSVPNASQQEMHPGLIPITVSDKPRDQQMKVAQIPQGFIEFPFMVPQSSEMQNESTLTNSLVNSDGTLTQMGLQLLFSNQSNRGNMSGKSDLDDVADILVNKMPIPSLKVLESSNLQTLYLHQLALSQLQQALTNNTETSDTQQEMVIKDTSTTPSNKKQQPSVNSSSFESILERHKYINEMIEEMNAKSKTTNQQSSSSKHGGSTRFSADANILTFSKSAIKPSNVIQTVPSISSALSKQNIDILTGTTTARKGHVPVLLATGDPSLLSIPKDISQDNQPAEEEEVHFTREKKEDSSINLQHLHSLILETSKRLQEGLQPMKLEVEQPPPPPPPEPQNINVAISQGASSGSSKMPVTLQGIIIDPTNNKHENEELVSPNSQVENIDVTGDEDGENRGKTYSGLNTVGEQPQYQAENKLYKCDLCGVPFSVYSTLQAHIKSAHKEKVEFCSFCQMSFKSMEDYYVHVAAHENAFNCQFCDKVFTSSGDYKKHLSRHTHRRPYSCYHCQKSFRDPGSLAKHERIHTGEHPFVCETCGRGFAEKSSLSKHKRVHSGEKPYKCELCDKSFSISGNLQRHMLIHTGKRPFKCTVCNKAFNNQSHLRRHIRNLHTAKGEDAKVGLVVPRAVSDEEMKDESVQ